ncbi:hypothetical protein RO3G_01626 [Rhizopus delemar RA 99-880]|uniref:Uncharacterized protein n=1 Tax=Rhizopus delemar (strain RA 99-880 / ATCC MYA-4621 / FGSC 9543 / NRRL 43880) TaxID=246409 RepID=I1BL42_RHIO9|nr:hypothetical protein RO3G_01626 [Rhizopus delemar RA 99-880]|eukprot:EIE76922.1 hypothetical protein RO3G_01626 [Rhizopus delemar RA 99-880]
MADRKKESASRYRSPDSYRRKSRSPSRHEHRHSRSFERRDKYDRDIKKRKKRHYSSDDESSDSGSSSISSDSSEGVN